MNKFINKKRINNTTPENWNWIIILNENIKVNIGNILDVKYKIIEYNSEDIPESYFEKLLDVANDWFWIKMDLVDVKNHLYKAKKVFILKINNEIVWFSSLANLQDFTYRFWTVIKKKYQANWLYKKLSKTIIWNNEKYFLRTQNKNVIKSLEKSFDVVLYWKDALNFLENSKININKINSFMLNVWDKKETLDKKGVFRWVYPWKMWDKRSVNYIDWEYLEDFNYELGDSLLVVYFNNKK